MQHRWHQDFEKEVGKTVRGGLALCKFKPWRKKETGSCSSSIRTLTWATVGVLSFSIPKDCIRFCDSELSVWWFMYSRVCRMVILKDLMRHQGHLRDWYNAQLWRRKWVNCCLSLWAYARAVVPGWLSFRGQSAVTALGDKTSFGPPFVFCVLELSKKSPCLWAYFHSLSPLSVVSAKKFQHLMHKVRK
jgi:hypothetical protein